MEFDINLVFSRPKGKVGEGVASKGFPAHHFPFSKVVDLASGEEASRGLHRRDSQPLVTSLGVRRSAGEPYKPDPPPSLYD
ncbi:hypothetical protein CRG98_024412 [Punica granatum]|uniref:Uncharacterized protein n=1 Tax=Punica granatum TaxID=22663 RepID=A0A2I0JFS6_PUNGR|nr:hypothetical protein CRG98_024412 [Punica granatum]